LSYDVVAPPFLTHFTGIAAADFNEDGWTDFLAQAGPLYVYPGAPGGSYSTHFQVPTTATAIGTWVGDLDSDGHQDILYFSYNSAHALRGLGNGTFRSDQATAIDLPSAYSSQGIVAVEDFNEDGKPDFAAKDHLGHVVIYLGQGDGTFSASPVIPFTGARLITSGDLDVDGHKDIIVGSEQNQLIFLHGLGTGQFQVLTPNPPLFFDGTALAVTDVDGDGRADILVTSSPSYVWFANSDGSFTYRTESLGPNVIGIAPITGTACRDLVCPFGSSVLIYPAVFGRVDLSSVQIPLPAFTAYAAIAGDFRRDGRVAIALAGSGGLRLLYPNRGVGITQHPTRTVVAAGDAATLSVVASGGPSLRYQWRRDGTNLYDGQRIAGSTSPDLTISSASMQDDGAVFDCVIASDCETRRSNGASLVVRAGCAADFDGSGRLDVQDLFDFIGAWLSGCP
jgi:hypothetical protein